MNIFDVRLETNRLLLRKLIESDVSDMYEYTSNPQVSRYLSWNPHTDIKQTENYIKSVISEYDFANSYVWALDLKEVHKLIGVVRIFDVCYSNKRGEISYIMNPKFQGKGLMIEAIVTVVDFCFNKLKFNRIQARCTTDNLSSEHVMQKIGMKYEGTLKDYWINKGSPADAKFYALTAKNYFKE